MTFWIVLLRILGGLMLIGAVVDFINFSQTDFASTPRFLSGQIIHNVEQFAIALVCFGVAAGLRSSRDTNERMIRATAPRRRQPNAQSPNVAPVAPTPASTARYMNEGEKIRHSGGGRTLRRVDQEYIDRKYAYRIPNPEVRAAPSPVRTTPGAEDQYAADTQQLHPFRPNRTPPVPPERMNIEADRDVLRQGRDAQLRRMQAEQSRKQKPRR